jgi:chlorite dismutase
MTQSPFHSYVFFDVRPNADGVCLPATDTEKESFIACLSSKSDVAWLAYGMLGFKSGMRFMVHTTGPSAEVLQDHLHDLIHTPLGMRLSISYTLFGMTKPSQYNPTHAPEASVFDAPHTYLVVYPFTKTTEWHLMPYDERRNIMKGHVDVGRKYSETISQMLLYAYGIDDHEFIVSYQMDSLPLFQQLVMDMRATESRRYTKNDLPIFMCMHVPIEKALGMV